MVSKLNQAAVAAYVSVKLFFAGLKNDFKNDERGLSGVVVAVLLILVAVLAVVAIWGGLSGWLSTMWESITGKSKLPDGPTLGGG